MPGPRGDMMRCSSNVLKRLQAEFPLRFGLGGIPDERLPGLLRSGAVPKEFHHDVIRRIIAKKLVGASDVPGIVARATDVTFLAEMARHPHAEVRAGVAVCPHTPPDEVERLTLDRSGQVRSAASARKRDTSGTEHAEVHMAILRTKSGSAITQILTDHPNYVADERVQRRLLEVFFQEAHTNPSGPVAQRVPTLGVAETNPAIEVRGNHFTVFDLGRARQAPWMQEHRDASLSGFMDALSAFVVETLPFTEDEAVYRESLGFLRICWAHHVNPSFGLPATSEGDYQSMWSDTPGPVLERVCALKPGFAKEILAHVQEYAIANRARYGEEIPSVIVQQLPFDVLLQAVW